MFCLDSSYLDTDREEMFLEAGGGSTGEQCTCDIHPPGIRNWVRGVATRKRHSHPLTQVVLTIPIAYAPITLGSNSSGKNCPCIFSPTGIGGTPSSGGLSEAETAPSRKTLITVARLGRLVSFSN